MIKMEMTQGSRLKCVTVERGNMRERGKAGRSMYSGGVC